MVFVGRNFHCSHCYKIKQILKLQNATNCYQPKHVGINKLNQMSWKTTNGFIICYEGNYYTRGPFEAPKSKLSGETPQNGCRRYWINLANNLRKVIATRNIWRPGHGSGSYLP